MSCVNGKDKLIFTVEKNCNLNPITVSVGEVLGVMEEVEIVPPGKWHVSDEKICNIQSTDEFYETGTEFYSSERAMKLFSMLEVEKSLEQDKDWALKKVIAEFNDMFAMSPDEMKCTELTRHVIDTNGHAAIKQLPRRTTFALRKRWRK